MTTQSAKRPAYAGSCVFCKTEVAKNKITQHLKFCKTRLATIAAQEEGSSQPKTRLWHIVAEGTYNPQYWLHFEVPASEPLWSLDDFLKEMWIDDLDHLSGFSINGTEYGEDYPEEYYAFSGDEEPEETEEPSEEEQAQQLNERREAILGLYTERSFLNWTTGEMTPLASQPQWISWLTELRKPGTTDELVDFLKEEQARIEKAIKALCREPEQNAAAGRAIQQNLQFLEYQKSTVDFLLTSIEDRSMDVLLQRVLKVGQKFSYTYDYGSSTRISLRVITEREGIAPKEHESVQLLARNNVPTFPCDECGKPAVKFVTDPYANYAEQKAYCAECAEKNSEEDEEYQILPITNSPRTGVL